MTLLTLAMPVARLAPMGWGLFWVIVSCPEPALYEYGNTTSPVSGVPDSVNRICPLRVMSMGLAGTGKYASGVPVAELTCALTNSVSLPVDGSMEKAVTSPHVVTVGPSAAAHAAGSGAWASSTNRFFWDPSVMMRNGFIPWLKNFCWKARMPVPPIANWEMLAPLHPIVVAVHGPLVTGSVPRFRT